MTTGEGVHSGATVVGNGDTSAEARYTLLVNTAREHGCHIGQPCSRAVLVTRASPGVLQVENNYVPIFYNWTPLPPSKFPLPMERILDPSYTWFSGSTRVLNLNGISIGSVVIAGLRPTNRLTDRQTDRQTTLHGR